MHVDEDLAEIAVFVLAGPQIDLVAADHGLLRVSATAERQFRPPLAFEHFLRKLLGEQHHLLPVVSRRGVLFVLGVVVR